jgi:UDP-N-acetyl-D-mannosaminuronate dehydrogenase
MVNPQKQVVVVGLGEVGKPLLQLISRHRPAIGVDLSAVENVGPVEVLHLCYPFQIPDFVAECARYIELYQPELTVINSTVAVGTTRKVAERTGTAVVNSPVRGKHARMLEELSSYAKFVGPIDARAGELAAAHFDSLGLKTNVLSSPEATELAKLTETTYFGLMIAWAQELERYCDLTGTSYEEIVSFYEEISFFPKVKYFPGVIGGHCVMPNIEILRKFNPSSLLEAIDLSNQLKMEREARLKEITTTVPEGVAVPQPA